MLYTFRIDAMSLNNQQVSRSPHLKSLCASFQKRITGRKADKED